MRGNDELIAEGLGIFRAGLAAVDPVGAVRATLKREGDRLVAGGVDLSLSAYSRVLVVGAGKASAGMAQAVEELVPEVERGLILVKHGHGRELAQVEVVEAGHPVPDAAGQDGAGRLRDLLETADESTLVFALISGGGSALLALPAEGITLDDKQAVTELLLAAGADIREMNAVRKHLSLVKGGQLARVLYPATAINLILSDVVGDRLDAIASGPLVPDGSSFAAAHAVLKRYQLLERVPSSVRERFERGVAGELPENPGLHDPVFERCHHIVVANNRAALDACAAEASARGFHPLVLSSSIEGEAREVARVLAAIAREVRSAGSPVAPPACVLAGGETTVTLRGAGRGGRNQELALAAAIEMCGMDGVALFSLGTDGTDGPTDAAGGVAFGDSVARMHEHGIDARTALATNDAYPALDAVGDLIRTGPTGTNVMDLQLILVSD